MFFNAVFGATNPALLSAELLEDIDRISSGDRSDIVGRLLSMIRFSLAFHPGRLRLGREDFAELLGQMQEELSDGSAPATRIVFSP